MTECQPWKNDEIRHYNVEAAPDVTGIKLVVTKTDDASVLRIYEFRPEFDVALAGLGSRSRARCFEIEGGRVHEERRKPT